MTSRLIFTALKISTSFACTLLLAISSRAVGQDPPTAPLCSLVVHVDNIRNQKGDIGVTLFQKKEGWPEDNSKAFLHGPHPFTGTSATITLQVPPGKYGIAVLHDENSNSKLDRNLFHIPKEGFGFSTNPHVLLTAPDFDTVAMPVACPRTEVNIHLIYK